MCYNRQYSGHELPKEYLLRLIWTSPPTLEFYFLGGEPLLRGDFCEVLENSVRAGHKTSFCTNGTLLTPKRVAEILDTGVSSVYVSLDGASTEANDAIRGPGNFRRCIEGLIELDRAIDRRSMDVELIVGATATQKNWQSILEIPALLDKLQVIVDKFTVGPVITVGFPTADPALRISENTYLDLCEALCSAWRSFSGIAYLCMPNPELVVRYLQRKYSLALPECITDCPVIQRRDVGRVLANGEIVPCNGRLDLLRRYHNSGTGGDRVFLGNLQGLDDSVLFDKWIHFFEPHCSLRADVCRACPYANHCQVCPMENFYQTGWRMCREKSCIEATRRIREAGLEAEVLGPLSGTRQSRGISREAIYFKKRRNGKEVLINPVMEQLAFVDGHLAALVRVLLQSNDIGPVIESGLHRGHSHSEAAEEVASALDVLARFGVDVAKYHKD